METKEAIELIKEMKEDYLYNIQRGEADEILVEMEKGRITDIVSLLKELETENKAYKEMWEEFKTEFTDCEMLHDSNPWGWVEIEMDKIKQKYLGGK